MPTRSENAVNPQLKFIAIVSISNANIPIKCIDQIPTPPKQMAAKINSLLRPASARNAARTMYKAINEPNTDIM